MCQEQAGGKRQDRGKELSYKVLWEEHCTHKGFSRQVTVSLLEVEKGQKKVSLKILFCNEE